MAAKRNPKTLEWLPIRISGEIHLNHLIEHVAPLRTSHRCDVWTWRRSTHKLPGALAILERVMTNCCTRCRRLGEMKLLSVFDGDDVIDYPGSSFSSAKNVSDTSVHCGRTTPRSRSSGSRPNCGRNALRDGVQGETA